MLGFRDKTQSSGIAELIAKKKYSKAVALIREQLTKRRRDPRLRLQLADVLALAGKTEEAVGLLSELADDHALAGSAAKAIALLKKIQALDPGRPDVEERLAYLISQQERPAPDPWSRARSEMTVIHPEPASSAKAAETAVFPGDIEEIHDEHAMEIGAASKPTPKPDSSGPVNEANDAGPILETMPSISAPPDASFDLGIKGRPAAPAKPASGAIAEEQDAASPKQLQDELMALIEDMFAGEVPIESASLSSIPVVDTPLFGDFTCQELIEVIRGLKLRAFGPGEIIVTEGEEGASLFVLTSGSVHAYVRDAGGRNVRVRSLREGDFFGEISLLKGGRRTATVTASSGCELLEIDRETFGAISQKHPRVWEVLKRFYDQRVSGTIEEAARADRGSEGASTR
jgi:hypothetical protein